MNGWTALLAVVAVGFVVSCRSISDSVTSPSRWLADSSQASADSSGASGDSSRSSSPSDDGAGDTGFRDDVRVATSRFVESSGDTVDWQRQLGRIAEHHGVSHWEGQSGAWIAIGSGLGEAGLSEGEVDEVLAQLGGVDAGQRSLVREGYTAAR